MTDQFEAIPVDEYQQIEAHLKVIKPDSTYEAFCPGGFKDGHLQEISWQHDDVPNDTIPWGPGHTKIVPGWFLRRCLQSGATFENIRLVIPKSSRAKTEAKEKPRKAAKKDEE